jgi:hypothetical protein
VSITSGIFDGPPKTLESFDCDRLTRLDSSFPTRCPPILPARSPQSVVEAEEEPFGIILLAELT